jgi:hypothetical protein
MEDDAASEYTQHFIRRSLHPKRKRESGSLDSVGALDGWLTMEVLDMETVLYREDMSS